MTRIGTDPEARLHVLCELCKGHPVEHELSWILGVRLLVPTQLTRHSRRDPIGPVRVPVIVETEHHHVVAAKELRLVAIRGVLLQGVGRIEMRIEGGLVRDQEVPSRGCRLLHHLERRHHRRRDALHGRRGLAGNDLVDGLGTPGNADVRLDAIDDLGRRQRRLRCCPRTGRESGAAVRPPLATRNVRLEISMPGL